MRIANLAECSLHGLEHSEMAALSLEHKMLALPEIKVCFQIK